jgi:hypothetical protein
VITAQPPGEENAVRSREPARYDAQEGPAGTGGSLNTDGIAPDAFTNEAQQLGEALLTGRRRQRAAVRSLGPTAMREPRPVERRL